MSIWTRILGATLWMFAATATTQAADWYVRPAANCAVNGNGTQPTCATSASGPGAANSFQNIPWGNIAANDTLYIIGEHIGVRLHNVVVKDIVSSNPADDSTCFWAKGEGMSIRDSRFENCGDDGIWAEGANLTFENNWIANVGSEPSTARGDCISIRRRGG